MNSNLGSASGVACPHCGKPVEQRVVGLPARMEPGQHPDDFAYGWNACLAAIAARVEPSEVEHRDLLAKVQREAYALEACPGDDDQLTAAVLREVETFITGLGGIRLPGTHAHRGRSLAGGEAAVRPRPRPYLNGFCAGCQQFATVFHLGGHRYRCTGCAQSEGVRICAGELQGPCPLDCGDGSCKLVESDRALLADGASGERRP